MKDEAQTKLEEKYREEYHHEADYSEGGEIDKQLEKLKEMGLDIQKPKE